MAELFQHPKLILLAMLLCSPVLFPLARFFFDDFDSFKHDVGLGTDLDRSLWLLGIIRLNPRLWMKIMGFITTYFAVVLAVYQLLTKLL